MMRLSAKALTPAQSSRSLKFATILCLGSTCLAAGCGRERRQITPTTTGTDLQVMPRSKMTPLPFPGSSLARSKTNPTTDPSAMTASGATEPESIGFR